MSRKGASDIVNIFHTGCQNLGYTLISLDTFVILQQGRLPLPKNRELTWIGITDEGVSQSLDA